MSLLRPNSNPQHKTWHQCEDAITSDGHAHEHRCRNRASCSGTGAGTERCPPAPVPEPITPLQHRCHRLTRLRSGPQATFGHEVRSRRKTSRFAYPRIKREEWYEDPGPGFWCWPALPPGPAPNQFTTDQQPWHQPSATAAHDPRRPSPSMATPACHVTKTHTPRSSSMTSCANDVRGAWGILAGRRLSCPPHTWRSAVVDPLERSRCTNRCGRVPRRSLTDGP